MTDNGVKVAGKLSIVWRSLARAIKRTPYQVMDRDSIMHTYFIVGPILGDRIKKGAPIYQLTLTEQGSFIYLDLLDANSRVLGKIKAQQIFSTITQHYT